MKVTYHYGAREGDGGEMKKATHEKVVMAVLYAMRNGCFFPVCEPRPKASANAWIRWGAMRNLHDAVAELTRANPLLGTWSRRLRKG